MNWLQGFLLRWIAARLVPNSGTHLMMQVIAEEARQTFYEDNWVTLEDYLRERLAVGVHNAAHDERRAN
jgi:hypothetical protein